MLRRFTIPALALSALGCSDNTLHVQKEEGSDARAARGEPRMEVDRDAVDFGDVPVAGQQSDELVAVEELRITNAGNGTLLLQDVALLEDLVVFDVGSVSLPSVAVGAELVLELTFNPTEPNAYEDTLVIETNDPVQDVFEIPLYGAGVSGR